MCSPRRGAGRVQAAGRLRELEGDALVGQLADLRVHEPWVEVPERELRVAVDQVLDALHGPGGHSVTLQGLHRVQGGALAGPLGDEGVELVLVGLAGVEGSEAGVAGPVRTADGEPEGRPFLRGGDGDGAPLVVAGAAVRPVGRAVGRAGAGARLTAAVGGPVQQCGLDERDGGLELADIYALPLARAVAMVEGRQDRHGGVEGVAAGVRVCEADVHGLAVGVAGQLIEGLTAPGRRSPGRGSLDAGPWSPCRAC